ncbi:hypothetical protein, partial [Pectobacterium carotovorum]|uniref:hypothetical protein n=1 Tax=Pectobacterium carotovorum TaxID=554 RepID=UPI0020C0AB6C
TLLFGGTLSRSQPSMPVFIYGEPSAHLGLFFIPVQIEKFGKLRAELSQSERRCWSLKGE